MKLTVFTIAAATALIAASSVASAQGVSSKSPGQEMQQKGSKGEPGASYYAPGQEMKRPNAKSYNSKAPGASGYAPGHSTTGSATKKDNDFDRDDTMKRNLK